MADMEEEELKSTELLSDLLAFHFMSREHKESASELVPRSVCLGVSNTESRRAW